MTVSEAYFSKAAWQFWLRQTLLAFVSIGVGVWFYRWLYDLKLLEAPQEFILIMVSEILFFMIVNFCISKWKVENSDGLSTS